jgi:hypothetical protein
VFSATPLKVSFRRALVGENLLKWRELVSGVLHVVLGEGRDNFVWTVGKTFSVKSMYNSLMSGWEYLRSAGCGELRYH